MIIIYLIIAIFMFLVIKSFVDWIFFLDKTKRLTYKYGKGNYNLLCYNYKKHNMKIYSKNIYDIIAYDSSSSCKVCANIIHFNNIGMTLGYIDYIRMELFLISEFRKKTKANLYDWEWESEIY